MGICLSQLEAEQDRLFKLYGDPARGTTRVTYFVNDDLVVKVPLSPYDVKCNLQEAAWAENKSQIPIAPCYLEYTEEGIPLLYMERVTPIYWNSPGWGDLPAWAHGLYDGCQVGFTKSGEIVAYDVGSEY